MGQKVHPIGFRLGITKTWSAQWYADKDYTKLLQEDLRIRKLVDEKLAAASISKVEIERGLNYVTVTVHSAKPGVVIGKGGTGRKCRNPGNHVILVGYPAAPIV